MLVLSRHRDESIMIGDDVVVTIVDIRGDKVRLGIEAPQSIPVHRQEGLRGDSARKPSSQSNRRRRDQRRAFGKTRIGLDHGIRETCTGESGSRDAWPQLPCF